ncbi:MAG: UvrD-helicase domain-containing protein [Bacteroidales bacterium]|nr:UvrD-helicase domain-containing protein [Bacteroidales bacterium]
MDNILKDLSPIQQDAVRQTDGPVLVIAGAGSGKTRVLTYKIAWLLEQGVQSRNILALTFTNKAAREMKDRIERLMKPEITRSLWMGTFHSLFSRILRRESQAIGYKQTFTIYDTDDTKSLIKSILHDMRLDDDIYPVGEVLRRISSAKNQLITPESYKANSEWMAVDESSRRQEMCNIYIMYANRCRNAGAMDFDDLLLNTYLLFQKNPDILRRYQDQFQYILVDEYQDTNYSQYSIVNMLAKARRNLCVVGDDSQSIYSFRGARIENILNFRNDYPEYKLFKLEQNYRSTQTIVEAANSLILKNQTRIPKTIWSAKETGDLVEVVQSLTDQEEGFFISNRILDTHLREQADFKDFVVLYRTHSQSRIIEEACRKQNIPYKIYGSISFYQRKEIKDILAYFRLILNHSDDESLKRVINYPARGIGKTTVDRLGEAAMQGECSIWTVLGDPAGHVPQFNRGTCEKLQQFRHLIEEFSALTDTVDAYDMAMQVVRTTGILEEYRFDRTPEGLSKFENIEQLINGIKEFVDQEYAEEEEVYLRSMDLFMQDVSLMTDQDNEKPEDRNKVSLMTIHSAKGLEFEYVFIAGVEEELFPSQFSSGSAREIEEERRLFYVAITRAMKRVIITLAKTRYRWGNLVDCRPSRFLREIDPKYLKTAGPSRSSISGRSMEDELEEETQQTSRPVRPPVRRIIPVSSKSVGKPVVVENFEPDDPASIQSGMMVTHPRFGNGKVLQIEGDGTNRMATVFFKDAGNKQLLLKFARLKIING